MDNFVVSARKYRPKGFDEVIGQDHITTTLKNAIDENHLAQALLFCGPRGVGKTTCARIVARMINDFEGEEQDLSFNIFELDAASNNSVDNIRSLIDQIRYPPQFGKYKIYIIDEVHMLSISAFNAFLKTLEEPPPYAIFILATTEKHKLIPTILSRCQIFDFNRIPISEIVGHLENIAEKEGIKTENEALHLIAQKADGALRDALSMFDLIVTYSSDQSITYQSTIKNLHVLDYDYYFKITDYLLNEDIASSLVLFDEILKKGFDGHNFISGLELHLRNLVVCKDPATIELLDEAENVKNKYQQQAENASTSFLLSALNIGSQCDLQYKNSKNQRLLVELTLMKMAHIPSVLDMSGSSTSNQESSDDTKKKTEIANSPPSPSKSEQTKNEIKTKSDIQPEKSDEKTILAEEDSNSVIAPEGKPDLQPVIKEKTDFKNLKKTTRIPSLNELSENVSEYSKATPNQDDADDQNPSIAETKRTSDITVDKLTFAWNEFKNTRKEKAQDLNVLSQPYELSDDNKTIILTLTNSIQLDILKEIRSDLLIFLKNNLENDMIRIKGNVSKEESKNLLYTNKEKFEHLANKHPLVKELQQTFNLDPEF